MRSDQSSGKDTKMSENYSENFGRMYRAQFNENNIFARLKQEQFSLIEKWRRRATALRWDFPIFTTHSQRE